MDDDVKSGVGLLIGGIVLVIALVVGIWALTVAWAPWKGEGDARKQTNSADYRIAAYDHFYSLCGDIQAVEDQLATMEADTSLPEDQRNTNILALTNKRNTLIREYNADARKEDTQGKFRASDLPYQLDPTEETTTCTA